MLPETNAKDPDLQGSLVSWIRIRESADPPIRIQGAKIFTEKTATKPNFDFKSRIWTIEKREIYKNFPNYWVVQ